MNKFVPGDKALVISSKGFEEVIGKVVEIINFVPLGQEYQINEEVIFSVDFRSSWHVKFEEKYQFEEDVTPLDEWVYFDSSLMPLKGDFKEEEEEIDVLLSLSN